MTKNTIHLILVVALCASQRVHAFELATHGLLTFNAYSDSALANEEFINSLGLKYETKPFGKKYVDATSTENGENGDRPRFSK
jgi:hypothetical protein